MGSESDLQGLSGAVRSGEVFASISCICSEQGIRPARSEDHIVLIA